MSDPQSDRLERLEAKVDQLAKKLDDLEDTVRQIFAEVRALYEQEDFEAH